MTPPRPPRLPPPWAREDWGPGGRGPGGHRHGPYGHGPHSGWRGFYGYGPRGPALPPEARLWLPVIVSAVLQVGIVSAVLFGSADSVSTADTALAFVFALAGPAALIGARRFPGPVVAVVSAVAVADSLVGGHILSSVIAVMFALALAVVRGARTWAIASATTGWVLAFAGAGILGVGWDPVAAVVVTAGLVIALGFGSSIRTRRERFAELRSMQTRRRVDAAQQERVRIARELHDVLAHSLSSINVQAGVGLHLLDSQPEKAGEALASIKATSKQALDEVRDVLGILRGDQADESDAPLVPEADLGSLPRLVENTRSAGLEIELVSELGTTPSAAIQLALYRIAQEGLTNVVRHSGATAARVDLSETPEGYVVQVSDNGSGVGADVGSVAGKGLLGMRERAELLGGHLEAENLDAGGFRVTATIPLPQRATRIP